MKAIKLVLLTMILSGPVWADDFQYTGNTAENIDPVGWFAGGAGYMGGPVANERLGLAQQFLMDKDTLASFLNVDADVRPGIGSITLQYKLYTGSSFVYFGDTHTRPIPDLNTLVFTSSPFTVTANDNEQQQQYQVAFDYQFTPGQYWIAEEGTGPAQVALQQTYVDPPSGDKFAVVAAPEPPSILLFLVGGLCMFFFRKKLALN